jgi:hypothetical protein
MKSRFTKIVFLISSILFAQVLSADGFTLKSDSMIGQISSSQVFNGFGCTGENISPKLSWENPPEGTKSFAITIYDPDAPTGSGWWHWVVFNIPKETKQISKNASSLNSLPKTSIQSKTDFGTTAFGGACPPKGDVPHAYITTVYALDTEKLDLDENANPALVGYMINMHTIAKSSVIAYYKR